MTSDKTYLILNDLQIPWVDQPVLDMVLAFAQDLQPDGVILNGDVVDCYAISDFQKDPLTKRGLGVEIEQAMALMESLEWVREKHWIGGNHEDRLRRYIWKNAPAFGALQELTFPKLFHTADYGFSWRPYGKYLMLGKLLVTHGSMVKKHSGESGRAHWDKYGESVLIGHTHRLGIYYKTQRGIPHAAYENGCLCRLDPEYVSDPDWQQGFSVVQVFKGGYFHVTQIPILNRKMFVYGGLVYSRGG